MLSDKKWLLLIAGLAVIFFSCEKEEEPLDLELPGVTLEVSGNLTKLYNEVTLTSAATDNGTIERVVFYVNSDSIGQATAEPYELIWNTKEVEDGPYMLKTVAYDTSGNKGEAAKEVTVNNTLLLLNVENGLISPWKGVTREQWVFLSDKQGNVLGEAKQVINGESLRWERPSDFYSDTLYVSQLYYSNYDATEWEPKVYTFVDIYTYTDFTLEEAYLKAYNSPDSVGKVDISVENDFENADWHLYETTFPSNRRSSSTSGNFVSYTVEMSKNSQQGLSTYENDIIQMDQRLREKYYRLDELKVGGSYSFHTDEYTAMPGHMVYFPFDLVIADIRTTGYFNTEKQGGYRIDYTNIWSREMRELKIFSADKFPYVCTSVSVETENKDFYLSTMGQVPGVYPLPEFSANAQTADMKHIEVTTHGAFDAGNSFWKYEEESDAAYLRARRGLYFNSESGASYILPEIPASLLERYPSLDNPMEYSQGWASEYQALNSYEGVLRNWFTYDYNSLEYLEYSGIYIYPASTGGRLLPNNRAQLPQGQAEEEYLRERGMLGY